MTDLGHRGRVAPQGPAWLFCPGDRPERFAKAARAADVVVLDLEDGVEPQYKAVARHAVASALHGDLDPARTIVRVNPPATSDGVADLKALMPTSVRMVMIPKATAPIYIAELGDLAVVALCETAQGVLDAHELARDESCIALALGGVDLSANLRLRPQRGDPGSPQAAIDHARLNVRFAAAAAGVGAIDTVCTELDDDLLAEEAARAAHLGFDGKLLIHPRQVAPVRAAFRPSAQDVAWARRVVTTAESTGSGASLLEGEMIDTAVVLRAREILARRGEA